jgi:hypothetical protein
MVSIPVSVYQTVVTSMAQLNGDGQQQVQIMTPLTDEELAAHDPHVTIKAMPDSDEEEMEEGGEEGEESDAEPQMVVAFQPPVQHHHHHQQKGAVPDATQAVEVMTVEPEMKAGL